MRHFKKIDWSISLSLLLACVLTVVAACVESSGPLGAPNVIEGRTVSSVQITLAQSALAPGQTTQATAVARAANGDVVAGRVDFSSQNPSIATVSSNGVVTAVTAGVAMIQAAVGCCAATAPVTVRALASTVAVVAVALDSTSLAIGHSARASATALDSAGNLITGQTVTWASLAPTVATVSPTGTVTAVAPGAATIQGTVAGTTGTASVTVLQVTSPVATVAVAIDSITLLVGHAAHAVATVRDASGTVIAAPTLTWTSLTPGVATVSSSGAVTAVTEGPAVIQATVSGIAGVDSLVAVVSPDLASHNFDDGSWAPYYNYWDPAVGGNGAVDVINDPTGAGKRKVARMHYSRTTGGDSNRYLQFGDQIGFGTTRYTRGEFYIDVADLGSGLWGRKLIYFRPHQAEIKYGGWREFGSILGVQGDVLWLNNFYVPASTGMVVERTAAIYTGLHPRTWYTIEAQLTPETTIGAGNGIYRVWLNGALIYQATDVRWTDPAWIGVPVPGGNGTPYDLADVYLDRIEFGNQVNLNSAGFDEYRYWDNVAVSRKRIGL